MARLDAAVLSGDQAATLVADLATIEKAAAAGRMLAAVRVAKTDAWRGQGHASAADWLAAQAGITVREAAAQLGTARKAASFPKTESKMREGKLSPTQAGAVTDAAAADPAAEDDLLASAAADTTAALKERAARTKAAATDAQAREQRIRAERSVRTRTDADGAFCLHLRGPAADGARLLALLRPYEQQALAAARRDRSGHTYENRTYDAFQRLLRSTTRAERPAAADGTEAMDRSPRAGAAAAPAARPAPPLPKGGNNIKVIVRVDHAALLRGHAVAGEVCDIAGVGPISAAAARDLLADAFLAVVVTKGRDVVTVAHHGRGLNAHQRTAIEWTGLRCANRACNRTVAPQIDHRTPYVERQETKLDNQDPLCPECHRRKTHHGWHLEPGQGRRRFLPPSPPGASMPSEPVRSAGSAGSAGSSEPAGSAGRSGPPGRAPAEPGQLALI